MSHNIISVDGALPNVKSEVTSGIQFIQFGQGETPASPSITIDVDETFPFYDTAPINTIEGASISTTNDVLDSITLPAGRYLNFINIGGAGITSGYAFAKYGMYNVSSTSGSVSSGSAVLIGPTKYQSFGSLYKPSWMHITTQQTIYIISDNVLPSGSTVTSTNSRYAKNSSLCILKVS